MDSNPANNWPAFAHQVAARLAQGRVTYGDRSFEADPAHLLDELQQETLDLAGWGFVLWSRLEAMRTALRNSRPASEPPQRRLVGYDRGRDEITEPEQIP